MIVLSRNSFRMIWVFLLLFTLFYNVEAAPLKCRGVMESFPQVEVGIDDRLDFYRSCGLTHYFYSPSDDRYCNGGGWKFLYNDSDRHTLRKLIASCRERSLEFVWVVNPGDRYSWNQADYMFLLDKLKMMYYNGIRSFAVRFFDKECAFEAVRDRLMRDFVATRKEPVSLYMIDALPVVAYPTEGCTAVETLMNGYRFDGEMLDRAKDCDMMLCDISSKDEFAKLAVIAVADCSRDVDNYSPERSLAGGVSILKEDAKEAFVTFLKHTGKEKSLSDVAAFSLADWTSDRAEALFLEFDRIEKVPQLLQSYTNSEIIESLRPWLVEFGRLGTRGKKVLRCMEYYNAGNISDFWIAYLSALMSEAELAEYERHPVGENLLHPFCMDSMRQMKEGFSAKLTGKTDIHNLASTLYAKPNMALDSDLSTGIPSNGHIEFAIPADANTCHLLTGPLPADGFLLFRQIGTDGSLIAEFVVKSPSTAFSLKEGAVKVDILGDVTVYENIFLYL